MDQTLPDAGPTEPSLTTRVVRGAGWMFAGKSAGRALAVIKLIILARLLSPDDFGLFGLMMLATMALDTFTRTGFGEALIQFKDDTDHLDTAWTLHVIRGFILAGTILLIAPFAARFFNEPRLIPLLQAFSVAPIISSLENIGAVYFRKELQFGKLITLNLCADILAMIVGIALAIILRNVWALVGATVTACVARVALSYVLHPYRPHFRMRRDSVRRLFHFGVWLTGSSILLFLAMKGDRIILGHLLGAYALGVFGMAWQIADLPASQIGSLLNQVMMPAYAKAQDARERMARAFQRVLELVATLVLPLAIFMMLGAPELVLGVIGDGWREAIMPLRILALVAFLRAIDSTTTPLFLGTGRPRLQFWKTLTRGAVTLTLVYPLTARYGINGTALAGLAGVLSLTPMMLWAMRITDTPIGSIVHSLMPGLLLAACVVLGILLARLLPILHPTIMLIAMALVVALLALPVAWGVYRVYDTGPFRLLKEGVAAADIKMPNWTES